MASLLWSTGSVVCISESSFIVICTRQRDSHTYKETRSKPGVAALAAGKESEPTTEQTNVAGEPPKDHSWPDSDPSHLPTGRILAGRFSPGGRFFALCDDYKTLSLYDTDRWHKLSTRTTPKRCIAVAFSHAEDYLYAADKFGDVYSFSVSEPSGEGHLILGHLSMLLDVVVSPDDQYILTADRDEKIRISQLPNAYNIHAFCLGHKEFVSRIAIVPGFDNILVTGGGDSTLRLWDYRVGKQLQCLPLQPHGDGEDEGQQQIVTGITCCQKHGLVAVTTLGSPYVSLFRITSSDSGSVHVLRLPSLNVQAVCWSACFDHLDRLWVLRRHQPGPLAVFSLTASSSEVSLQPLDSPEDESDVASVLRQINSDWSFFEGAVDAPSPYANLFKRTFDNAKAYLERKEQRIKDQQQKKGSKGKGGSPPLGKKAKLDEKDEKTADSRS